MIRFISLADDRLSATDSLAGVKAKPGTSFEPYALLVCQNCLIQPSSLHLSSPTPTTEVIWAASHSLETSLLALYDKRGPGLNQLYEFIDKTVIRTAFEYCERNQLQTARFLGISRNVLRARLIRYNCSENHLKRVASGYRLGEHSA